MNALKLHTTKHPDAAAQRRYEALIGLGGQKEDLLDHLVLLLDSTRLDTWIQEHHVAGLPVLERLRSRSPLVVLAGEVGCGKTELATSIGSPLAAALDAHIVAFETPSDIRGNGLVGDLSARVTSAFEQARAGVTGRKRGLLIIDEGDDLGTSRSQMQAHHEDRAGLNVLIKQIDGTGKGEVPLAVLLITNRLAALDPALVRRAHVIRFRRPGQAERRELFERVLMGTAASSEQIDALIAATERPIPFSYSDLVHKITEPALRLAVRSNKPFSIEVVLSVAERAEPTPLIEDNTPPE